MTTAAPDAGDDQHPTPDERELRGRPLRDDPVMARDDDDTSYTVEKLLQAANQAATTLFVFALGFDPRCLYALKRFVQEVGIPTVVAIEPQPSSGRHDSHTTELRASNAAELVGLVGEHAYRLLPYPDVHDEASAGRLLAQTLTAAELLQGVDSVVFDISACPTSLSFPPLAALLEICGVPGYPRELQVLVTENPEFDGRIQKSSLGSAHTLAGFGAGRQALAGPRIKVWAPVLGLSGGGGLRRAADFIAPDEVCPVLPFPSQDPRMPDRILTEHHELLVDEFGVGHNNLIYAAENNPFDLYRTLVAFDRDYQSILHPLGGAAVRISMHGSKLLSVGALLAAFERRLQVVSVRANVYAIDSDAYDPAVAALDRLTCLWLRGTPYEASDV